MCNNNNTSTTCNTLFLLDYLQLRTVFDNNSYNRLHKQHSLLFGLTVTTSTTTTSGRKSATFNSKTEFIFRFINVELTAAYMLQSRHFQRFFFISINTVINLSISNRIQRVLSFRKTADKNQNVSVIYFIPFQQNLMLFF